MPFLLVDTHRVYMYTSLLHNIIKYSLFFDI